MLHSSPEYRRMKRLLNREKVLEKERIYREKTREKRNEYYRNWVAKRLEKNKAYHREYYLKHRVLKPRVWSHKQIMPHTEGYVLVYEPRHPYSNKHGYVPEHRLVLEKALGYYIDPKKYHVHHIDGNKSNNITENLMLLTPAEHSRIHAKWEKINDIWFKTCRKCERFLELEINFYRRSNGVYISHCKNCISQRNKERKVN